MHRLIRFLSSPLDVINSRLKYQLFMTYMIIVCSILLITSIIFYNFFSNRNVEKYYQYMAQLNNQIILNLDNSINNLENTTFLVNYEDDLIALNTKNNTDHILDFNNINSKEYKSVDNYFFNLIYSVREIHGVYIYSTDGTNILARNRGLNGHTNLEAENESWFKQAIEKKGEKVLVGRHKNKFVNENVEVISVARALINFSNNNILGVIIVDREVSQIEKIINDIKIGARGAVLILDEKNNLVYTNNNEMYKTISSENQFKKNIYLKGNSTYTIGKGTKSLLINQGYSDYSNWKVIISQPYTDLINEIVEFERILVFFLIACLIVTFIMSAFISSRMSRKLNIMKKVMIQVENGNFQVKMNIRGKNEIVRLAEGFNSMLSEIRRLISLEYNEKLLRKEAELNLLQAQINPHFLYNTLGSIKSLAEMEGDKKVALMIHNLSRLFRYNLGRVGRIVTVKDELDHIKNYLFIQAHRFEDKLTITYDINEQTLLEEVPVFTFQPIVENAFIHGFGPKIGINSLIIKIAYEDTRTMIYITDNGMGNSQTKEQELNEDLNVSSHAARSIIQDRIGLYNVNLRIKYCFGDEYGLNFSRNLNEGVTVAIALPRKPHT
jgi:two-component system sensor histidine kinase YesM